MESSRIKAVVFDLGNVLIDFNHTIAAKRISGFTEKQGPEIFNLFFNSDITTRFEAGKLSPEEFFLEVKRLLNLKLDFKGFVPIWNEIFFLTEKNQQVYSLAKALKESYKVGLISNINALHFEYLKKNFPIFDAFHAVIASCEVGFIKPQPPIYEKALEILGTDAKETFYTDDRQELVESATRLGIRAFLFQGLEQLKKDFALLGVRVN